MVVEENGDKNEKIEVRIKVVRIGILRMIEIIRWDQIVGSDRRIGRFCKFAEITNGIMNMLIVNHFQLKKKTLKTHTLS